MDRSIEMVDFDANTIKYPIQMVLVSVYKERDISIYFEAQSPEDLQETIHSYIDMDFSTLHTFEEHIALLNQIAEYPYEKMEVKEVAIAWHTLISIVMNNFPDHNLLCKTMIMRKKTYTKLYVKYYCKYCKVLKTKDEIKQCTKCTLRPTYYCSRECQKNDWANHKKNCKR